MHLLRRFSRDRCGNIAITFAAVVFPVIFAAGIAVDFGRAFKTRTALQGATDAAALAVAKAKGLSEGERKTLGQKAATANFGTDVTTNISIVGDTVTVTANYDVPATFTRILRNSDIPIGVGSVANGPSTKLCVLLLDPSDIALNVNSYSSLNADCGLHINSENEEALYVNSYADVIASSVCVKGQANINSGSTVSPDPGSGCFPMKDPLATLPEPYNADDPCDHTDYKVSSGETKTMWPGVYCKKTLVENGGTAIMQAGIYVFREGAFEINSGASVSGSGVMLFFKDKDAFLNVNSDSNFQVSAPMSGTYAGILMFQSRDLETLNAPPHIINSDSSTILEGVIYMPNGVLEVNSHSDANRSAAWTAIIARRMVVNSDGTFHVNSDYSSGPPYPSDLSEFDIVPLVWLTE